MTTHTINQINLTYARIKNNVDEVKRGLEEIAIAWEKGFFLPCNALIVEKYKAPLESWANYRKFSDRLFLLYITVFPHRENPYVFINRQLDNAANLKKRCDELQKEAGIFSRELLSMLNQLAAIEKVCTDFLTELEQHLKAARELSKEAIHFAQEHCQTELSSIYSSISTSAANFSSFLHDAKTAIVQQKKRPKLFLGLNRSDRKLSKHYAKIDQLLDEAQKKLIRLGSQAFLIDSAQKSVWSLMRTSQEFQRSWDLDKKSPARTETLQEKAARLLYLGHLQEEQVRKNFDYCGLEQELNALQNEWRGVNKHFLPLHGETRMKDLVARIRLHQNKYPISGMNLLVDYILENVKGKSLPNIGDKGLDDSMVTEKIQFQMMKDFMLEYGIGAKLSFHSFNPRSLAQQIWYDSLYKYLDDVINDPSTVKEEAHYFAHAERLFAVEETTNQSQSKNRRPVSRLETDVEKFRAIVELLCIWPEAAEKLHKSIAPKLQKLLLESVSSVSDEFRLVGLKNTNAQPFSAKDILALLEDTSDGIDPKSKGNHSCKTIKPELLKSTLTLVKSTLDTYTKTTFFRRKGTRELERAFKRICASQ